MCLLEVFLYIWRILTRARVILMKITRMYFMIFLFCYFSIVFVKFSRFFFLILKSIHILIFCVASIHPLHQIWNKQKVLETLFFLGLVHQKEKNNNNKKLIIMMEYWAQKKKIYLKICVLFEIWWWRNENRWRTGFRRIKKKTRWVMCNKFHRELARQ